MSRKDFVVIAKALASVEAYIHTLRDDGDEPTADEVLRIAVDRLARALAAGNPRFDRGVFEAASLPLRNRR